MRLRLSGRSTRRSTGPFLLATAMFAATILASGSLVGCGTASPQVGTTSPDQLDFGVDMARRGLWSEALFRFRRADQLEPGDPKVLNNMAVAYEALGQFERALDFYQKAIEADPTNRDLRRNYSRFVEFYRAFRPDDQRDASLDDISGDDTAFEGEP